jgi:signal transduction histidine kinase
MDNLFRAFTKIMNHRELNRDGVGLGLTISKNLVHALGGNIQV